MTWLLLLFLPFLQGGGQEIVVPLFEVWEETVYNETYYVNWQPGELYEFRSGSQRLDGSRPAIYTVPFRIKENCP